MLSHKLEHKRVANTEGGVSLNGEFKAVLRRPRNQQHMRRSRPDVGRITRRTVLRIAVDVAHFGTQPFGFVGNTLADVAIDFLELVDVRIVVNQR